MKKVILIIVALSLAILSYAKEKNPYLKGEILLSNGTIKTCLVKIPKAPSDRKIAFKSTVDGEKESIQVEDITSITVYSNSGKSYVLECLRLDLRPKAGKTKITKHKAILFLLNEGYAKLYAASNAYKVNQDGDVEVTHIYQQGADMPTFNYYIKKEGEDVATYFCYTIPSSPMIGLQKVLIHRCEIVLSDDQKLIERVKNEEFNNMQIPEIIQAYNEGK